MLAAAAALSFLFLLSPYCDSAEAAEAPPAVQKSPGTSGHGHDHPAPGDACPSLDHTPVFPPATALSLAGDGPANPPLGRVADTIAIAGDGSMGVRPRATSPFVETLPLYLRYAHLLI